MQFNRRHFVKALTTTAAALATNQRAAGGVPSSRTLRGTHFDLNLDYLPINVSGKQRLATAVNGLLPGPTLRWKEGDQVSLRVTNQLAQDSSIHWHGIILPTTMDGVPGMSFPGIRPGESFEYRFQLEQSGTYWYHSHSGFQEQTGLYGAIVVEPRNGDQDGADRDHVILLSDWTDQDPAAIYAKLKKLSHYYNYNERTFSDLWRDISRKGVGATWRERAMWNEMRMSDSDIADVTGYAYTYLMNGDAPDPGWIGDFKAGETVKLRFINGSAMSIFDVRIPGLELTVVAADGQDIEPVTVDEFRIGTAETYDVLVRPKSDTAYTLFAQSIDRSGYARGTLTPHPTLTATVPIMDPAPVLGHQDMAMDHMEHSDGQTGLMSTHQHHPNSQAGAGLGSREKIIHAPSEYGPHTDMRADSPTSGVLDPGIGLRHHPRWHGRRVLNYGMLRNRYPTIDRRDPSREIQLHLTGNMSRYMWSFDGIKFADAAPIQLKFGERVRFHLVNDTMMTHPIHLHGMWSELETGEPEYIPRKHTVLVQPGKTISYLVTADAMGRWAYHCHLQYHMMGMMREVRVT